MPKYDNSTAVNMAHSDGNQNFSMLGVIGTLGTADTKGTAPTLAPGIDPTTGALYVNNIGASGGGGTTVTVDHGSITATSGTINAATAILNSGTINVATAVMPSGTLNTGTINTGTFVMTSGTLNVGTAVMPSGTLNVGTINTGTFVANGGTIAQLTIGSIVVVGFVQSQLGTLNAGTINAGTVTAQLNPLPVVNTITTAGTTTSGTIGTLISAPGAGTGIYITAFNILQVSGTAEVVLSYGLQSSGNQVIAHGNFPVGGGITENKTFPSRYGTTNAGLTYNILSGSGTVSYKVEYFVSI